MTVVLQADSTYARIESTIRRLTALSSQQALPSSEIQTTTNIFYNTYMPYSLKIDQMRDVYTFYTQPNIDRYPLDVNYNQGVRAPFYVDGIQGSFYKERQLFFSVWPKFSNLHHPINGDGVTQIFSFTIPGPFLSKTFTLGGVDTTGKAITVSDDGNGNLNYLNPNPVTSVPVQVNNAGIGKAIPGMLNNNNGNPGLYNQITIGAVNYVTGVCSVDFAIANVIPIAGQQMSCWVSPYTTGRPIALLFWNNEFHVRPVPKIIHQLTVETFLTPVQFMLTTDNPILNQWSLYIAYGVSMEILRQRMDFEGVKILAEGFKQQEENILCRQGTEELFQATPTLFNSPSTYSTGPWGNSGSGSW